MIDPAVTAVTRCFALQARWQRYPEHIPTTYRAWFTEAFGTVGEHLWQQFDPADVARWFANLDARNRAIFLTHERFS